MTRSSGCIRPALLLVYVLEVRIDDPGLSGTARILGAPGGRSDCGAAFRVHLRADLHRLRPQRLEGPAELCDVVRREDLPEGLQLLLDGLPRGLRDAISRFLEDLLGLVNESIRQVPGLDELAAPAIVLRVLFPVLQCTDALDLS